MPMTFKAAVELIAARMDYYANNHTAQCASWRHSGALLESCDCGIATAVHVLELAAGQGSAVPPSPQKLNESRSPDGDGQEVGAYEANRRVSGVACSERASTAGSEPADSHTKLAEASAVQASMLPEKYTNPVCAQEGCQFLFTMVPKWLPIASAPKDTPVLTFRGAGLMAVAEHIAHPKFYPKVDKLIWICTDGVELLNVTHWMPLPDPPGATDTPK